MASMWRELDALSAARAEPLARFIPFYAALSPVTAAIVVVAS